MRVGIVILPDRRWRDGANRWRRAEEYGFHHAWTYDHIGWRDLVDGPWFDAVATLTAAATITSTIRLGTLVSSPNFRHPVPFAREVTALDDVSAGRFTLGVGAGGTGYDAGVLGVPLLSPRERADRYAEFVELIHLLLTDGRATWRGTHYAAEDARSTPGCVQSPRVPLVLAANGVRTMRLAARYGDGWVTTGRSSETAGQWWGSVAEMVARFEDVLAAAGRDPAAVDRYLSLDAAPIFSLSSVEVFADAVGRAAELGFTDVVAHWPREHGWYRGDEAVLAEVAARFLSR